MVSRERISDPATLAMVWNSRGDSTERCPSMAAHQAIPDSAVAVEALQRIAGGTEFDGDGRTPLATGGNACKSDRCRISRHSTAPASLLLTVDACCCRHRALLAPLARHDPLDEALSDSHHQCGTHWHRLAHDSWRAHLQSTHRHRRCDR